MNVMDRLIALIIEKQNPTVMGLDTQFNYLPEDMQRRYAAFSDNAFESASMGILEYNKTLIDVLCDIIPAVKVQAAYYEQYGWQGMKTFQQTLRYAHEKGMITIADVKRNDIGSTAAAYSRAYLGSAALPDGSYGSAFEADIATVNPYLGSDGILPFVEDCEKNEKGIFVLVKTSNPSSGELQDLAVEGKPVYRRVGELVGKWGSGLIGKHGYSAVGAVIGATYKQQGEQMRKLLPGVFFLLPGYGAQGAAGADLAGMFDENGLGCVVNASRSLLLAYRNEKYSGLSFAQAAHEEALAMKADICANIAMAT